MVDYIGIDAGGSLVKLAYIEQGKLHTKTFSNQHLDEVVKWLSFLSPSAELFVTGGKASSLKSLTQNNCHFFNEFQAVTAGTKYLLKENGVVNEEFILVNIGTGTSIFHVTANSFERVLGSGIGGGTLMGLGYLITRHKDFQTFIRMASEGDSRNSDLLVRDIYAPEEPPIHGNLTAANLGKAHLNEGATNNDHLASVMQLIGETILLLANQVATTKQISQIVFVGGTVTNNPELKDIFMRFRDMMSYEPIFLDKGTHAGAIGALLSR
ncbi:type II pantothenate kinase [Ornithinibacillus californiensis]|uniref:type II pantothenate kinase n=1 Tax=Ornithinibacillus californiensis TaxID=161536 RepID=UPI00064DACA8|nr:type II pantothenate kinase [Ornithinibacillus californiensis]